MKNITITEATPSPIHACSIFNARGTVHVWTRIDDMTARSNCGAVSDPVELDEEVSGLPRCKKCFQGVN